MIIVGDIGNTDTKIFLINNQNKIIKRVKLNTKKINSIVLKKSMSNLNLKNYFINKCLFCSVVPQSFKVIKFF